jgi:deoxyribodipyrimidine photo-lyase
MRSTARPAPILLWFRQDLRLADHPALHAALDAGGPVIPVYLWSPEEEGAWPPGEAARWWIRQSLASLDESLRARGSRLVIGRGPVVEALRELCRKTGAGRIIFHRRCEPAAREQEDAVLAAFPPGLTGAPGAEPHASALLFEPGEIATRAGRPFQVFTPFWKACLARPEPAAPLPAPRAIPGPARWPRSLDLAGLGLEPPTDRAAGFRGAWRPGETGAKAQLGSFLDDALARYPEGRDRPDRAGSSRLSPHLHHGEISPRQVWNAVRRQAARGRAPGLLAGAEEFLRELGWREFAHHLLCHFPHTTDRPLRAEFVAFPWARDGAGLSAWQRGRTGYPIVDAGMRELQATGWMHNRVRMVAASFLVKDLLLPWTEGARWFWDTLVDADLANNTLGWQWAAGCGADAAPYFRIFNPVLQGERFDPDGVYVRQWVPELATLPGKRVQWPTGATTSELEVAGVRLGRTYPRPVVDHAAARARALAALGRMRGRAR